MERKYTKQFYLVHGMLCCTNSCTNLKPIHHHSVHALRQRLITVAEVPRLRRPSSPCVLRSDRQDSPLTQPHKTKLQRGHSDCARRPIHLPVKQLSTHVRTQSAKRGVAPSCLTCSSSKLPHWETVDSTELPRTAFRRQPFNLTITL